jgi:glycosyltransferase involved in cell wall biosynthesis
LHLDISPNPLTCAGIPGGVNSVVSDHAAGFLAGGHTIGTGGIKIVHAMAQAEDIDVFHCHGLYPIGPGYFNESHSRSNDILLQNALKAKVTVCISEFSANILRHKLHINPVVTRNGIWLKEYERGGSQPGPVIFAKAALDANAKPDDVLWLKQNLALDLLSIANIPGVKSTGKLSRAKFLETLKGCSVYLGTTKENNSMATMEAMAIGVPVVGYNIGFNREWLRSGYGCELVQAGDRQALKGAISQVKSNWKKYSRQAREFAQVFDWQPVIDELIGIYENVARTPEHKTVSIVIPCHNYERWLGAAIESALAQTVKCEIVVVDDCSTDGSRNVASQYPVKLIRNQVNLGVAETRNAGIQAARGEFIVCLDADDLLRPDFVEKHLSAFRSNADAIAYAPINLIDENGANRNQVMFRADAVPALHAVGRNQIPSCCMFRKSFWERAGGYEARYTPAEDAHLWLKIFGLGGQARRAAKEPLMDYRVHGNSLSARGFPNWWQGTSVHFSDPIRERDSNVVIVIDENDKDAQAKLWLLEKQQYKNWNAAMENPSPSLLKAFPWLNQPAQLSSHASLLHLKPNQELSANFLDEFMNTTPPWITGRAHP